MLGTGALGRACAAALAAHPNTAPVHLLTRDKALAEASLESGGPSRKSLHGGAADPPRAVASPNIHLKVLSITDGCPSVSPGAAPLFLCTPAVSYLRPDDGWANVALGAEHSSITHDYLRAIGQQHTATTTGGDAGGAVPLFVGVFTRGLSVDGVSPAQQCDDLLNDAATSAASNARRPVVPTVVLSGPIIAREWIGQSTPPPAPAPVGPASPAAAAAPTSTAAPSARAFSGTALTAALYTPSIAADAGRIADLAAAVAALFPRESTTFLTDADAGAVLSLVNSCLPLCAFGAGMVSHVYQGATGSALASYAEHAADSTTQLVNGILARPSGTPLPLSVWSTIYSVCTDFTARELILGRRMDFYFRRQDAAQAIYRGAGHHQFGATVDGVATLLQRHGVSNSFYAALMDAHATLLRASRVGEGLVKRGYAGYGEPAGETVLLQHAMALDGAAIAGDEDRLAAAKKNILTTFHDALF